MQARYSNKYQKYEDESNSKNKNRIYRNFIALILFAISGSARQSNNGRKESMRYEPT